MTFFQRRGSKYGNESTVYEGRVYHSKKEAGFAKELDLMRHATDPTKRVVEIVPQFSVKIWIGEDGKITDEPRGYKICEYRPDFRVKYADGHEEIFEVKGFWTSEARFKWCLTEALYSTKYPDVVLTIIK